MYYYLNGRLAVAQPSFAVIDCGGVGYKCNISMNTYNAVAGKDTVKLFTYLNVREDAMDLFGFAEEQERQVFLSLTSISGVGPKVALSILSEFLPEEFAACVLTSDHKRLTKVSGVGPKLAQRICLELKDKIESTRVDISDLPDEESLSGGASEAVAVLVALGYSRSDSEKAVRKCSAEDTGDIVKQSLRQLSRHLG